MTSETDKSKEKIPSYTDHGCFLLPKGFPVEGFKSGLAYEAQGEHIIIFERVPIVGMVSQFSTWSAKTWYTCICMWAPLH